MKMKSIQEMSLREKVGQMFLILPDSLEGKSELAQLSGQVQNGTSEVTRELREVYDRYPCGGFTLLAKNITGKEQLIRFTRDLHSLGTVRPMIAIDEEGGRVARIGNHPVNFHVPQIPHMSDIAETGDPEKAYEVGQTIGRYLKDYGMDIDFAPVADVNTNPENPVIGRRTFGDDPELAAKMVVRCYEGLKSEGIEGCLKHFPGHGDTKTDSHKGYAETTKTWEEIQACEMIPFMAGIRAKCGMIMTAHITVPAVTGTLPSTVSSEMLTGKLRGELGYTGLIITDALNMGAITSQYDSAEAAIRCILAGADIALMPYDYMAAFDGLMEAVHQGRIPEQRINESVARILSYKEQLQRI